MKITNLFFSSLPDENDIKRTYINTISTAHNVEIVLYPPAIEAKLDYGK